MKFILGTKKYMTQIFTEDGQAIPGTVITAGPAVVTQIKTEKTDGYNAVQIGFGFKSKKNSSQALVGHFKKGASATLPEGKVFRYLKEFRVSAEALAKVSVGEVIDLSKFELGDSLVISGISKGKGFQGVVKRHGFAGGPRSHGQKHSEREPGSIGSTGPQRVFKGTRMGGRMGSDRISVKNVKVAQINLAENELFVSGPVPGKPGTLLEIKTN